MYLRKSRAEELTDTAGEVLAKHRALLNDFAASRNIRVDDVYEEVISGESIAARPQMKKLLEAVGAGKYYAVLCVEIDRLGRGGMQDQGVILDTFRESGTLIITPDKTYDLSNETDEQLTEFKAFMSRQEYKIIRKRMRRGLMQTVEAGGYVMVAPYGYRKIRKDRMPTLEIVPEEAGFVRYMYRRYLEGVGSTTIAEELNAMGSKSRINQKWNRNSVRAILRNPTYKGMIARNRVKHYRPGSGKYEKHHDVYYPEESWVLCPGLHEAIISPEDWEKVQTVRKSRYIPSHNTGQVVNPLAGLVVCKKCGHNMQRMSMSKGIPYLLCNTKGCCAGAKFEYVEEALVLILEQRLERLKIEAGAAGPVDISAEEAVINGTGAELAKIEARLPRLYEFLEDGTYDRDTFRARMQELEERKKSLAAKREEAEEQIARKRRENLQAAADELENLLKAYPAMTAGDRNRALKGAIEKIVYTKEKKSAQRDFQLEIIPRHFIW